MRIPERLETKRLILKPYPKELNNEFFKNYKISEPGFNLIIYNIENDDYLGICGLYSIENSKSVGCLYALLPEFRGNGFAIEAMKKLIDYAFFNLEIPKVVAYLHPDNSSGWKVAERIGMKYMGQFRVKNFNPKAMLFTISKSEYFVQHSY